MLKIFASIKAAAQEEHSIALYAHAIGNSPDYSHSIDLESLASIIKAGHNNGLRFTTAREAVA
jgi:hypothetical protein